MHYFNEKYFPSKKQLCCPPEDSHSFNGTLYRFTQSSPISTMKDWEAYVTNEIKRKRWVDSCDYSTLCKSSGVSCYQTEAEAKNAFEAMKKRSPAFRKKFNGIFSVDISPVDGVLAETSNPKNTYRHFTFWINNKSKITTNNYTCIKE